MDRPQSAAAQMYDDLKMTARIYQQNVGTIDAVDKGGAVFIYNLDKITNIKIDEYK